MFTGIIEHTGEVVERREGVHGVTFVVAAPRLVEGMRPGDSVAINGVCHTIENLRTAGLEVTSVAQTLRLTTMGDLVKGDLVNLERAANATTALGGQIVQGHVDGVGVVVSFDEADDERRLTIALPEEIHETVVDRGSIAVDGVSLTVARRHEQPRITIAIVPYTSAHTVIANYREGARVNVEADVIGKYVKQYVDRWQTAADTHDNR